MRYGPPFRYARRRDGRRLAYQVVGDGDLDLVFLFGWPTHLGLMWEHPAFAGFLGKLSSFSRLVLFDRLGDGLSDRGPTGHTFDDEMDDVRCVLDAAGSRRAAFFGCHTGGRLALLLAATHPDEVSAVVTFGSHPATLRDHDYPWGSTPEEREEVFAAFGPDPSMQIFGRGLKRRLPPMMDGDPRRIRMAYSLLFSLPGTPTLYYGEEIGMGEDPEAEGRMAVRTPMQWEPTRNGGFSTAPSSRLVQRVVPDGYGPEHVNVADQKRDPDSLWNFMRSLVQTYRECPELGWGDFAVLPQSHPEVMAHRCHWEGSSVIAVHNLSAEPVTALITLHPDDLEGEEPVWLEDLFDHQSVDLEGGEAKLPLEGYGHSWFRVRRGEA